MSKWVVIGFIEGELFISSSDNNLPIREGRAFITEYAIYEQKLLSKIPKTIYLGLEIDDDLDHVYIAYQEMEAFIRTLATIKNVSISVFGLHMTNNETEWPSNIAFIKAYRQIKPEEWGPYLHHQDPKNRIRVNGIRGLVSLSNLSEEEFHERFLMFREHNSFQSEIVKDYIIALETRFRQPSLAVLYFFKVIERVAKENYGESHGKTLSNRVFEAMIEDIRELLTTEEVNMAPRILRWRNTKSEAHLLDEGMPSKEEVRLCRKIAKIFLDKTV